VALRFARLANTVAGAGAIKDSTASNLDWESFTRKQTHRGRKLLAVVAEGSTLRQEARALGMSDSVTARRLAWMPVGSAIISRWLRRQHRDFAVKTSTFFLAGQIPP
jgi:hypothetical protein